MAKQFVNEAHNINGFNFTLYEAPGENFSFGQGEAQRANAMLS